MMRTIVALSSPIRFIAAPDGAVMSRYPGDVLSESLLDLIRADQARTLAQQYAIASRLGLIGEVGA